MVCVIGRDPPMQFVHEDDLVELLALLIDSPRAGIFNVAGNDVLKYSEVAGILGKKMLKLPCKLLEMAISVSWAAHLQSASPVSGLEYLKYPPVVSTEKLRKELGFEFRYSSRQSLVSFAEALAEKHNR
jgi:UDP-glucose 4-epimerase